MLQIPTASAVRPLLGVALVLGLAAPAAASSEAEPVAFLEACIAAAGGPGRAATTTCFGQVTQRCLVATDLTAHDLVGCATEEYTSWSILLETTLQRLEEGEPPERMALIRRAQELWQPWRDVRCAIYTTYEGDLFRPLAVRCLAETTADRLVDLWQIEQGLVAE